MLQQCVALGYVVYEGTASVFMLFVRLNIAFMGRIKINLFLLLIFSGLIYFV